jgi:hypothetical protein
MAQHSTRVLEITGPLPLYRLIRLAGLTLVPLLSAEIGCKSNHQPSAGSSHTTDSIPQPHQGSWTDTRLARGPGFTLLIPTVATAELHARDTVFWITDLPQCRFFCAIEVTVRPNATRVPLKDFVARLQETDSAENDPDLTAYQPGPATLVQVGDQQGFLVQANCGDCTGASLFVSRGAAIAKIAYSIDDRETEEKALANALLSVAQTFRWTEK